jgi:hypothetical protein
MAVRHTASICKGLFVLVSELNSGLKWEVLIVMEKNLTSAQFVKKLLL